jgi:hypothetical protein
LTSQLFETSVKEFKSQFEGPDQYMFPIKLDGFPEDVLIAGTSARIPGRSLLSGERPSRAEYISIVESGTGKSRVTFNMSTATKFEAWMDTVLLFFVMLVLIGVSFSMNRTLDVLLDIEKLAGISKIMLQKNVVDEEQYENMTTEDLGVMAMLGVERVDLAHREVTGATGKSGSFLHVSGQWLSCRMFIQMRLVHGHSISSQCQTWTRCRW